MQTTHRFIFKNAADMAAVPDQSVELVITSPPYPMIAMWDDLFSQLDPRIGNALEAHDGPLAFERMHRNLDAVWRELRRILKPGGMACINIGDAARSLNGAFALHPNHARVISQMLQLGFTVLPTILWRKPTNAPTKFMGSGMLPPSAYVTLEHEHILIFRNGGKREFRSQRDKTRRRQSALFWEERNRWFSDVWMDVRGTVQHLADGAARKRSAAFPFEIPYRLINMFSIKGDTVVDPFAGLGTTACAAMAAGRHSIGYELDRNLAEPLFASLDRIVDLANTRIRKRIDDHIAFIKEGTPKSPWKHTNQHYGFAVVTQQERELVFDSLKAVRRQTRDAVLADYAALPAHPDGSWDGLR